MSKIGQIPIKLPENVSVEFSGNLIKVKGPKGELVREIPPQITFSQDGGVLKFFLKVKKPKFLAIYGTIRSLVANMVRGVSDGWVKELELVGAGYRAEVSGKDLILTVGYSHPVKIQAPAGITFKVEKTTLTVSGIDKELVGQVAAEIRAVRKPEPYKGKGIKYRDEVIRRKPGKATKGTGAA